MTVFFSFFFLNTQVRAEQAPHGVPPLELPEYTITSSGTSVVRASQPLPLKATREERTSLFFLNSTADYEEDLKALLRVPAEVVPLGSYLSPISITSMRPPVRILQVSGKVYVCLYLFVYVYILFSFFSELQSLSHSLFSSLSLSSHIHTHKRDQKGNT